MKKIFLLLVSGLLITCMAGPAMASADITLGTREVQINNTDAAVLEFSLLATASPNYKMILTTPPGVSGYILPDSTTGNPIPSFTPWVTGTTGEKIFEIAPAQASVSHNGKLYLKGNTAGEVSISVYEGTSSTPEATWKLKTYTTVDTQIPEFPTVALPVAAILGLVFIFRHKKDEL
ncbi:MAG: PEF-CTERM sorting domain-containing protein [Methanosarcina sp.]|uniref:PEF-CTERM sorting domain-containing protein n=1 Tax=Methanosarcina sp. TaxID=2213 RepID=UPI00262DD587|nr:PEF-CTERM sorting domain-containing protein [Methanosarcina sp.]MDD3245973.1 PEF-CTERM sorting domain-containing protein [Methanosarcina sp.]MDD4249035.1 PEF-CTERM sorting domain-containing protein [Methanosarcina sp.]